MNGPQHYAEAERLMTLAESCDWTTGPDTPYLAPSLAAAQVHATLALVAVTAEDDAETGKTGAQCDAWAKVTEAT